MIITNVLGGLGNQMFQFAAGLGVSLRTGSRVMVDNSGFRGYSLHNGYELDSVFDGVPEAERASPPLTTIVQPIAGIGKRAVELILRADGAVHRETLPVRLVVRPEMITLSRVTRSNSRKMASRCSASPM